MRFSLEYFFVFILIASVRSQYISDSPCPDRPIQQNFDVDKYASGGGWYEILRYDVPFEKGCNCGFANYTFNSDNTIRVRNCCKRLPDTKLACSIGQAIVSQPDHVPLEGKLNVAFGNRPNTNSNYWILSTDYENYSIVYYCKNIDDGKSSSLAWLLSRKPSLDDSVKAAAEKLVDEHFDRSKMITPEQSDEQCEPRDDA